jgi:DNA invertase Pin-like site-specific DNA recombinase
LDVSTQTERPGLAALLKDARPGDVIAVVAIDRLGRTVGEVTRTIADLGARGILLRALRAGKRQQQRRRLGATGEPVHEPPDAFGMSRATAYRYLSATASP